jgi:transcriptional regulator with XRE-family HTH domain
MPQRPGHAKIRQIGRQLRLLREKSGRTLAQLAEAAGLSERAVREFEAGRTNPSLTTVVSIADALGVTLDALIGAARRDVPADLTRAPAAGEVATKLTRQLPSPRMRARLLRLDRNVAHELPAAAVFGHVLSGAVRVWLDGKKMTLRRGDSFHAQAGVLTGWQVGATGAGLLVAEVATPAAEIAGAQQHLRQEPQ